MSELETLAAGLDSSSGLVASGSATATMSDTRADGSAGPPEPERGQAIGRYLVLERLGAGAMGVVFAAYDPELDRRVAIKVLHPRHGGERAQALLVREAQSLARVAHACVVAVHDVGVHDGRVFLAMEYVEGLTLRTWLADPTRTLSERLRVLGLAGQGLVAAHRAGLVHRDFKPDNVMIGAHGEVKVMDFGLARSQAGQGSELGGDWSGSVETLAPGALTQVGALIGTPAYMAPEQLAGLSANAGSDQFAFAVSAYETLYGARPFVGENLSALALAISDGRVAEPPKHHRVPPWLRRVILRGLESEPALRWPDLDSLLRAMANDPLRARRRRGLAGAALGLSASIGALVAWLATAPDPPVAICTDLVAGFEGRWTEADRQALELALASDPATRTTVMRSLEGYVAAWDVANLDNCTSTHVAHTQGQRVHELRASCLRHGRIAFEELVRMAGDTATQATPQARQHVVEASARLPPIEACRDVPALELEPALPTDPELRERVEAMRDEIAALESTVEIHSESATERARELAARANEIPYPPVQAEAALVLGRALSIADQLADATLELRRAYFVAMASGDTRTQAKAAAKLVFTVGYQQQDHRQGKEWADHALAIVARLGVGGLDGLIEADVHHALGVLLLAAGELPGSSAAYARAYELRQRLLPALHPDLAYSLQAMASVHHSLGELERARELNQRSLELRISLFGPEHPVIAGSLNNLSLVLRDLGQLDQAKLQLERAIAIVERANGTQASGLPRLLTNLARIECQLDHTERARELETRSLAIRRATVGDTHPEVADSIVSLAQIALDEGELELAETLVRDGLARLQRDFAVGHPEIFSASLVLALVLEARGQPDQAAQVLVGALADSQVENLEPKDLAEAKAILARVAG